MYGGGMGMGSYGGGMGMGGYGGGMGMGGYGGSMGGYGMQQQNGQQAGEQQQDPNAQYQFDLRRDLQQTIGGLNASLGLAFGLAQMANLGTVTLKYAWRLTRFLFGKVFSLRNITVPLKFLTSLLFGFRYLTKEERANERALREAWNETDVSFSTRSAAAGLRSGATLEPKSKTWGLMKRGRILGLSKMLVKSLIFAVAGILATLVFRFINRRKALQLQQMEDEEKRKAKQLLDEEWEKIEQSKQPLLQIMATSAGATPSTQLPERAPTGGSLADQTPQFSLPWSEEESKQDYRGHRGGYDGELTAMTFNHVVKSDAFATRDQLMEQLERQYALDQGIDVREDNSVKGPSDFFKK